MKSPKASSPHETHWGKEQRRQSTHGRRPTLSADGKGGKNSQGEQKGTLAEKKGGGTEPSLRP